MVETTAVFRISWAALRSAEALDTGDVSTLFRHLYTYNSLPSNGLLNRRVPVVDLLRVEQGLRSGGMFDALLTQHWTRAPEEIADGWLTWIRPNRYERLSGSASSVVFKLYLSPSVEALTLATKALIETLTYAPATSFKIGACAADLLRPDKMVVYFPTQEDLVHSARQLADRLVDVPPQGVPFTAEIAGEGLLSWGVDPPVQARALGESAQSWREWVCHQLAIGIAEAEDSSGVAPAEQALTRIRGLGVDTKRWLPPVASWGRALR